MTRYASGVMCDICGKNVGPQQNCVVFNMHLDIMFGEPCHAHTGKCEESFRAAQKSGNWRELPPGPLRTFFEQLEASYETSRGG